MADLVDRTWPRKLTLARCSPEAGCSHVAYEERSISAAVDDQVEATGWTTAVFDFRS